MTIFRMYADYGDRAGFWVQHRSWRNACALIISVGGQRVGRLAGRPPLFDSPEVRVQWHDLRSGRPLDPPSAQDGPNRLDQPGDIHYAFIAEPSWSRRVLADLVASEAAAAGRALAGSGHP